MIRMDQVKKRIGEVIDDLIFRNNLSNAKLAEIMKCSTSAIDQYRRKKTIPKSMFFNGLHDWFGVNILWLYYGVGDRYLGNGLLEQPGDEPDEAPCADISPAFTDGALAAGPAEADEAGKPWHERNPDALTKLMWLLELDSSWSRTMEGNLDSFDRACKAERKKERMKKKLDQVLDELASLKPE